jgi:hypothetical protein
MKLVDSKEDEWDNVDLNSHLSVDAWKAKVELQKGTKAKSSKDGVTVKSMKWAASALRV